MMLVVTGTGTGIGKTLFSEALVRAWSRTAIVAGVKPVESGWEGHGDVTILGQVSTFHVTRFPPPYLLKQAVSPHLAARAEGRTIELPVIEDWIRPIREHAQGVVVELAGGLFTPLADDLTNADLARLLAPTWTLLVAPDRLGVLHDVLATVRAALAEDVVIDGIVLSTPAERDASTGTNAVELGRVLPRTPVLTTLPRATVEDLEPFAGHVLARLGAATYGGDEPHPGRRPL